MAGPYPPDYGAGPPGPQMYPPQQFPAEPYPEQAGPGGYPPPPVGYRRRRRWPWLVGGGLLALVLAVVVYLVLDISRAGTTRVSPTLTDATAQAAIQEYLDALTNGNDEVVARHTLCGLFDDVKERRSDLALASLSGDAFRKQYRRAEVTSIDKIVMWSPHQAQVLFTMRVTPAKRAGRDQAESEQQAVAQLLTQDDETLVCSYLPRSAGHY